MDSNVKIDIKFFCLRFSSLFSEYYLMFVLCKIVYNYNIYAVGRVVPLCPTSTMCQNDKGGNCMLLQLLKTLRKLTLQLLMAAGFLKQNNVIHADLKPENILLANCKTDIGVGMCVGLGWVGWGCFMEGGGAFQIVCVCGGGGGVIHVGVCVGG